MCLRVSLSRTKKITIMALMIATAIATNYVLIGVVNVKFMDLIVFTAGYMLGTIWGAGVGFLVWIAYGTLNPYGFSLPILIATALSETVFGLCGGLFPLKISLNEGFVPDFRLAVTGFLLTVVYDIVTNIVSVITVGVPLGIGLIAGIPFSLMHEISNAAFFSLGLPPLVRAINQFMRH
jgi:hypothetical protein